MKTQLGKKIVNLMKTKEKLKHSLFQTKKYYRSSQWGCIGSEHLYYADTNVSYIINNASFYA